MSDYSLVPRLSQPHSQVLPLLSGESLGLISNWEDILQYSSLVDLHMYTFELEQCKWA